MTEENRTNYDKVIRAIGERRGNVKFIRDDYSDSINFMKKFKVDPTKLDGYNRMCGLF